MSDVLIIDSGVANLASVLGAFRRLGAEVAVSADPAAVRAASRVVLPGVGAFGAGMARLASTGLGAAVRDAASGDVPLLGICLGMQLLGEASEESPGVAGLGIVPGTWRRLPAGVRVPHLGWNRVEPDSDCRFVAAGEAAYANSYALREAPAGWSAAWTTHGERFVAAIQRENVLACQFHPELSSDWGMALLGRWLRGEAAPLAETETRQPGMLRRLVPCLDVRDGRVVKGVNFQGLRDVGDPARLAAAYEAQGADEIVVLDVAASPAGKETQLETVRRVRAALGIPLTVGGGVRTVEDARALLAAGADKVSVNTAAVARPALLAELAEEFGRQCVVLAIDARRYNPAPNNNGTPSPSPPLALAPPPNHPLYEVLIMGGRESARLNAVAWARQGVQLGAGEILLTSWDRDGTRAGHDLALLAAVTAAVDVPVIASGGIGTRAHVAEAFAAGAEAVLAASILHDGDDTVAGVKQSLITQNIPVRP